MTPILAFLGLAMLVLLGGGVWIGLALLGIGAGALEVFRDMPVVKLLGQLSWNATTQAELASLPLFILMAEILFRTRLSDQIFAGLAPLARRLPGQLLHVNVLGCTLFAAVSGSSAATAATVGRITLPELERRGYAKSAAMGSLAGAGTLGFLIPPSIVMIVYGVLAEVSIIKLFMAGILPGLLLALGFMIWIGIHSRINNRLVPSGEAVLTWRETGRALANLGPVLVLIFALIGSMYAGLATPNEAAAVGVWGALALGAFQRSLSLAKLVDALMAGVRTTSMIGLILVGAAFLTTAVGYLGVPRAIVGAVSEWGLGPFALIAMLLLIYIVLGMFLDGISMIVMTLPLVLPLVVAAGYDPIWFGVFLVVAVELAQVTPPVGMNLFVIQGLAKVPMGEVAQAALPYFLIMIGFALLLAVWPDLAMLLPRLAAG
ncbi:MAG: C4-dicarboxylate ABC transporter permease [Methylobacterium sp.]|nr:MAG: C4-dicarboxylate ABC transporter permease [Methylobacterium sp.]